MEEEVSRAQLMRHMDALPRCFVGMEACCGAHHLARELTALDHDVRLMAPQFVKPILKSNKNNYLDAEAIAEAVQRPTMRGSAYTARETRVFARQLGLEPCFTPVRSPQSNGISEAFVHTLKRDYVHVSPLPDALTALTSLADGSRTTTTPARIQDSKCVRRASIAHWVQHPLNFVW